MTHQELVRRAERWIQQRRSRPLTWKDQATELVVFAEMVLVADAAAKEEQREAIQLSPSDDAILNSSKGGMKL